jgi:hypothetical protein
MTTKKRPAPVKGYLTLTFDETGIVTRGAAYGTAAMRFYDALLNYTGKCPICKQTPAPATGETTTTTKERK